MIRNIYSDVSRAVGSRRFVAAIFGLVFVISFSSIGDITKDIIRNPEPLEYGFHAGFIFNALRSDSFKLALPILVALPFTTAFIDDMKSGFIKQYVSRTSRLTYIVGKLVAAAVSGGLVLFAGILIAFIISVLVFTPMELSFKPPEIEQEQTQETENESELINEFGGEPQESEQNSESVPPPPPNQRYEPDSDLSENQPRPPKYWLEILKKAFMLFFSGMFWSLTGFVLSSFTMNRYMAYASPFILYYILIILHERYFPSFYVLYPGEWISPEQEWVFGNFGVIILISMLTLIISLWFASFAERRLTNNV